MRRNDDFYPPRPRSGDADRVERIEEFQIPEEAVTQHGDGLYLPLVEPLITSGGLRYPTETAPAIPAADVLRTYADKVAGRVLPWTINPEGRAVPLQSALCCVNVTRWRPGTAATASIADGVAWTVAATQSTPAITTASYIAQSKRGVFTTTAIAGNASGVRSANPVCWRGNAADLGGFFFHGRIGIETFGAAMQLWIGLSASAALLAGDPSAVNNSIALIKDQADANWHVLHRDGTTATKIDTGLAVAANQVLDVFLYCPPNSNIITVRVERVDSSSVLVNETVLSTTLPSSTSLLRAHCEGRTNAAAAVAIACMGMEIETET